MSGKLSQAFVFGLQGQNPRYILANAGCKHFDVYAGPEDIPESRHSFNAKVHIMLFSRNALFFKPKNV